MDPRRRIVNIVIGQQVNCPMNASRSLSPKVVYRRGLFYLNTWQTRLCSWFLHIIVKFLGGDGWPTHLRDMNVVGFDLISHTTQIQRMFLKQTLLRFNVCQSKANSYYTVPSNSA
jgi:hypothetical protein